MAINTSIAVGDSSYDSGVAQFIRRQFGRYVNKEQGYSLRVTYDNFPGMNIRYVEGPRTMNVFGELLADLKELELFLGTFGHWKPPYDSEVLDDERRRLILERISSALKYLGYIVTPIARK